VQKKAAKRERGSIIPIARLTYIIGAERNLFSNTRGADGDSHSRKSRNGPKCVYYIRQHEDLAARASG
jgi:hypothetical protein